jgi:hypothetical protein
MNTFELNRIINKLEAYFSALLALPISALAHFMEHSA